MQGRIVIVDDDQGMCEMLAADLKHRGFIPVWFTQVEDALQAIKTTECDVLLTDLNMPGINGIELCKRTVAIRPDIPVVVFTAFGSMDTAVSALRAGAFDFVIKPVDLDILSLVLERAYKTRELQEKLKLLNETLQRTQRCENLLGESPVMLSLFKLINHIATTDSTILITGESGTGKELVAQALHQQSARSNKPFLALNCAAIPETLLESELFGHKRGAYTDAREDRKGLLQQAEGGTLFLDEIGDFPLTLQPKLLRALEERRIRPLGSDHEIPFDVRILSATNRDLEASVESGTFRKDLFYRIHVINLSVPPLRARGSDILLLAQHFLLQLANRSHKAIQGISKSAAHKLMEYPWPGNVRELRNAIEHAVALTHFDQISDEDLPDKIRMFQNTQFVLGGFNPEELVPLEAVERRYIQHVLHSVGNNRTRAAQILGLDRKTLYRKLQSEEPD